MILSRAVKLWIKWQAKRYAEANWYGFLIGVNDGDSMKLVIRRSYIAGAKYGAKCQQEDEQHRSTGEEMLLPPH